MKLPIKLPFFFKPGDKVTMKAFGVGDDPYQTEDGEYVIFRTIRGNTVPIKVSALEYAEELKARGINIDPASQATLREVDDILYQVDQAAHYGGPEAAAQMEQAQLALRLQASQVTTGLTEQYYQQQAAQSGQTPDDIRNASRMVYEGSKQRAIRRDALPDRGWESHFENEVESMIAQAGFKPKTGEWYVMQAFDLMLKKSIDLAKSGKGTPAATSLMSVIDDEINNGYKGLGKYLQEYYRFREHDQDFSVEANMYRAVSWLKETISDKNNQSGEYLKDYFDHSYAKMYQDFNKERSQMVGRLPGNKLPFKPDVSRLPTELPETFTSQEANALVDYAKAQKNIYPGTHKVARHAIARLYESIPEDEKLAAAAHLTDTNHGLEALHRRKYRSTAQEIATGDESINIESELHYILSTAAMAAEGDTQGKIQAIKTIARSLAKIDSQMNYDNLAGKAELTPGSKAFMSRLNNQWAAISVNTGVGTGEGPDLRNLILYPDKRKAGILSNRSLKILHGKGEQVPPSKLEIPLPAPAGKNPEAPAPEPAPEQPSARPTPPEQPSREQTNTEAEPERERLIKTGKQLHTEDGYIINIIRDEHGPRWEIASPTGEKLDSVSTAGFSDGVDATTIREQAERAAFDIINTHRGRNVEPKVPIEIPTSDEPVPAPSSVKPKKPRSEKKQNKSPRPTSKRTQTFAFTDSLHMSDENIALKEKLEAKVNENGLKIKTMLSGSSFSVQDASGKDVLVLGYRAKDASLVMMARGESGGMEIVSEETAMSILDKAKAVEEAPAVAPDTKVGRPGAALTNENNPEKPEEPSTETDNTEESNKTVGITGEFKSKVYQDNPYFRNPNDPWAQEWIKGAAQKPTAEYSGIVKVSDLINLPGMNNEHINIKEGDERVAALVESMKERGYDAKEPIFINVEADGKTHVSEGNHRLRAAAALGMTDVPVRIRYYGGGETAENALVPDELRQHIEENRPKPKVEEAQPATEDKPEEAAQESLDFSEEPPQANHEDVGDGVVEAGEEAVDAPSDPVDDAAPTESNDSVAPQAAPLKVQEEFIERLNETSRSQFEEISSLAAKYKLSVEPSQRPNDFTLVDKDNRRTTIAINKKGELFVLPPGSMKPIPYSAKEAFSTFDPKAFDNVGGAADMSEEDEEKLKARYRAQARKEEREKSVRDLLKERKQFAKPDLEWNPEEYGQKTKADGTPTPGYIRYHLHKLGITDRVMNGKTHKETVDYLKKKLMKELKGTIPVDIEDFVKPKEARKSTINVIKSFFTRKD